MTCAHYNLHYNLELSSITEKLKIALLERLESKVDKKNKLENLK